MTSEYCGTEDTEEYRPSYFERKRLAEFDVTPTENGAEITDTALVAWKPTEKQLEFLDRLLNDDECQLSLYKAIHTVGGTMRELNRWCRTEPQFLVMLRDQVQERFALAEVGADLVVIGATSGQLEPTKHEKWGVEALLKIRDFLHKREMRFIQINQQFNFGPMADQDDEALLKVIHDAGDVGTQTVRAAIEGGKGEGSC